MAPVVALVLAVGLVPAKAQPTVDLGLTPSHVFSLWTNVNGALVVIAEIVGANGGWAEDIRAMAPEPVTGKKPADVLEQAQVFREKLDKLRQRSSLSATEKYGTGDGAITPSVVFLNSGHILDATVEWLIKNTGREQLVSEFYTRHDFSGKTPSDPFALIVLANRRIDNILTHAN
ncbi:MAG: hypothetical protein IID48_15750 [Proteobacteria bacterium]|nr:hypothetical protein [Pseudomonadota bacterium]